MSTQINCTECGEPKAVEGRNVVLPFVCDDCTTAKEFLDNIKPQSSLPRTAAQPEVAGLADHLDYQNEADPETGPTVENTNDLIQTLQTELEEDAKQIDADGDLIADLSTQLAEANKNVETLRSVNEEMRLQKEEAFRSFDHSQKEVVRIKVVNADLESRLKDAVDRQLELGLQSFGQSIVIAGLLGELEEAHQFEESSHRQLGMQKVAFERQIAQLKSGGEYLIQRNTQLRDRADSYYSEAKRAKQDLYITNQTLASYKERNSEKRELLNELRKYRIVRWIESLIEKRKERREAGTNSFGPGA